VVRVVGTEQEEAMVVGEEVEEREKGEDGGKGAGVEEMGEVEVAGEDSVEVVDEVVKEEG